MPDDEFEDKISRIARGFSYPPTPSITLRRTRFVPRFAPALLLAVIIAACILSAPTVYAGVITLLRIGSEEIIVSTDVPAPPALPIQLQDLPGATTLAEAKVSFPLRLRRPELYPLPDKVYVLDRGEIVVMVWLDPADPDGIRAVLYQATPEGYIFKAADTDLEEVYVNGYTGLWSTGSQWVQLGERYHIRNPIVVGVDDNVLIWFMGNVTYRLEGDLSQEEALEVGNSLILVSE